MKTAITMEINNKIEVRAQDDQWAKTILQEITGNVISIAVPVLNGLNYLLSNNEKVECIYNDGKGNVYGFTAKVVGRKIEKIPLVLMELESGLKKIQRRDFVRVAYTGTVKYMPIDKYNESILHDLGKCKFKQGKTLDISGGGLRIQIKDVLKLGQLLVINLVIGTSKVLAIGEVVRNEGLKPGKEREYVYGVKLKYIDSNNREDIIKFIFENMRKSIKVN